MVKTVADHSQRPDLGVAQLLSKLKALRDEGHDPWHVCCGHHLTEVLTLALRKAIATNDAGALDAGGVEQMLRLAYEDAYFLATRLHAAVRTWEALHPPYVVLR